MLTILDVVRRSTGFFEKASYAEVIKAGALDFIKKPIDRAELEAKLLAERSPFPLMESFSLHELIDPRQTRRKLCQWTDWIEPGLAALKGPATWGYRP